jgi:hypothetical protein
VVVLENVVFDEHTREVDYVDSSVTGNNKSTYIWLSWNKMSIPLVCAYQKDFCKIKNLLYWAANSALPANSPWYMLSWFFWLQKTREQHILLITFQMLRYRALVPIRRTSFYWHVMHLACSHLWASWAWHRPCITLSVVIQLW